MNEQQELHTEKIAQARAYMRERSIDLAVIRDRGSGDPSVALLFGTKTAGDSVYLMTRERSIALVEERDRPVVVESGLFDEVVTHAGSDTAAAGGSASGVASAAASAAAYPSLAELLSRRVSRIDPGSIAINISRDNHLADGLTVGSYRSLLKMLGEPYRERIVSSEDYLQKLRSIKTPEEIGYIRKAIEITLEIYDEVFAAVRPGMSEIEVGDLFVAGMRAREVVNGISRDLSPPIVMKHKIAHRPPGEGILEPGDYLIMDFSVDYKGYCSDIARTAYILAEGETEASPVMQEAFRTVREATDAALALLKPGAIGKDVDAAARQYVLERGYPNIFHAVGHQVGRDVHDGGTMLGPEKQRYRKAARGSIEEGMVFAVEPTILYEQGPAIISEDNYVVTADGPELLGEPQKELVLIGPRRVAAAGNS